MDRAGKGTDMNVLYDSNAWSVVDYPGCGIELVDKTGSRLAFLEGRIASKLRATLTNVDDGPGDEALDEFLGYFDALLTTPVALH
jgi:hypothetical protein